MSSSSLVALGEGYRGPDGRLGYLLRQAHQSMRTAIDQATREHGITPPQYSIMSVLRQEPGLSGAQVARQSLLRPQSVNEMVIALERAGHVERRSNAVDRRTRTIYLTESGSTVFDAVSQVVAEVEQRVLDELSPSARAGLLTGLVKTAVLLDGSNGP